MDLNTAMKRLDPTNDDHWTTRGTPRAIVLTRMVGWFVERRHMDFVCPRLTRAKQAAWLEQTAGA